MMKFGIFTSSATLWFHLHPYEPTLYYYLVADCLQFIETSMPSKVNGRSKDGTVSACGFLVPKSAPFVKRRKLNRERVGPIESWQKLTDRETGLRGLELTVTLLRLGVFPELGMKVKVSEAQTDQYASRDIFVGKAPSEIKTERIISANLFVQDEEGGHRPTLLADGTIHHSDLPPFTFAVQLPLIQDETK